MIVTFQKSPIVGLIALLLGGCSTIGDRLSAEQRMVQSNADNTRVVSQSALEACMPESGSPFHFRKDILVAGTIGVPHLARDLPGLSPLTSRRLQTHLDSLGRFNVLATHDSSFESASPGTPARVRQLGQEHDSQFVVKLELQDLTVHSSGGWFAKLMGGGSKRHVLMKLYIYGTEYGALFHSKRYDAMVSGDVVGFPGNGNSVTTPWFYTDLGKKIDDMLIAMSMEINEKLACVPFSTEVTAVKGSDIHINAGFLHGIRPGETLRVYGSRVGNSASNEPRKQGEVERWIKVHSVFPNRSIAIVAQDQIDHDHLDAGDVVRAW